MTQLIHADEPFVHQPEDQLRAAPPAVRVAMPNLVRFEQHAFCAQVVGDRFGHLADMFAGQPVEAVDVHAIFVKWGNRRQTELLTEEKVFLATAWSNMDDARTFVLAHPGPRNYAMLDARHGRQLVEGTVIAPIEHFGAANVLLDLPAIAQHP